MSRAVGVGDLPVGDFGQCSTIHICVPIRQKMMPSVIDTQLRKVQQQQKWLTSARRCWIGPSPRAKALSPGIATHHVTLFAIVSNFSVNGEIRACDVAASWNVRLLTFDNWFGKRKKIQMSNQ
jgi:hypothetical protein